MKRRTFLQILGIAPVAMRHGHAAVAPAAPAERSQAAAQVAAPAAESQRRVRGSDVTEGDLWLDTDTGRTYICVDAAMGATQWKQVW